MLRLLRTTAAAVARPAATSSEAMWRRGKGLGGVRVEFVVASFDGEGFCVGECVGDFFMG